jgi:hypothetical protein
MVTLPLAPGEAAISSALAMSSNGTGRLTTSAYFLQLVTRFLGHLEDLVRIAHRPDDGNLAAHDVDEVNGHRLLMNTDGPTVAPFLPTTSAVAHPDPSVLAT